ncbi:MAG TPA: fumarylacetoacetate hydrolase family protein [Euzebyales bacterium]|nr:fumarylacetoacetate hydrolase family protein [Euzebyales bacterium]
MKLVTFSHGSGRARVGALVDGGVVDLTAAGLPTDMVELIALGHDGLDRARRAAEGATGIPADDVRLHAPLLPPNNVMAVGRNYHDHAAEFSASGFDASERQVVPRHPIIFTKARTSIIGPGDAIVTGNDPLSSTDYEGELAVVIGPGGRHISRERAYDHVYGYTVVNDVTARELQKRHVQFFIGKSVDTYCPIGPALVTRDEVPDITSRVLRTTVDGELRQESPISALIFDIPALIATLSEALTLHPGDVIATGTPQGVGIGFDPPRYLQPGNVVTVEIDGIGALRNPVE